MTMKKLLESLNKISQESADFVGEPFRRDEHLGEADEVDMNIMSYYEVYQCDPSDQFSFIGDALLKTNSLPKAESLAYRLWQENQHNAYMVWQPIHRYSRGSYGTMDSENVSEAMNLPPDHPWWDLSPQERSQKMRDAEFKRSSEEAEVWHKGLKPANVTPIARHNNDDIAESAFDGDEILDQITTAYQSLTTGGHVASTGLESLKTVYELLRSALMKGDTIEYNRTLKYVSSKYPDATDLLYDDIPGGDFTLAEEIRAAFEDYVSNEKYDADKIYPSKSKTPAADKKKPKAEKKVDPKAVNESAGATTKFTASELLSLANDIAASIVDEYKHQEVEGDQIPSAPDSSKFMASRGGMIEYCKKETVHGNRYAGPSLVQPFVKVGGKVPHTVKNEMMQEFIASISDNTDITFGPNKGSTRTSDGYDVYLKTADGTNWGGFGLVFHKVAKVSESADQIAEGPSGKPNLANVKPVKFNDQEQLEETDAEEIDGPQVYKIDDMREDSRFNPETDNFTADDITALAKINDLQTLKDQAKELVKGKKERRMKPEKIAYFYRAIDKANTNMKIIKLMYDLLLAGEGLKTIGTTNSMEPNSYRKQFGEAQSMTQALSNTLSKVEPGSKIDKKIKHHNAMVRQFGQGTMDKAPSGYHMDKKGMIRLGEGFTVTPGINRERYTDLSAEGLEGPFQMKNGKVLYYDKKAGKYYDRDTDMYVEYDDYRAMNEDAADDRWELYSGDESGSGYACYHIPRHKATPGEQRFRHHFKGQTQLSHSKHYPDNWKDEINGVTENTDDGDWGNTPFEAYGIKGMKRTQWRKIFKNGKQAAAWCEKHDAEIHGSREVDTSEMPSSMRGKSQGFMREDEELNELSRNTLNRYMDNAEEKRIKNKPEGSKKSSLKGYSTAFNKLHMQGKVKVPATEDAAPQIPPIPDQNGTVKPTQPTGTVNPNQNPNQTATDADASDTANTQQASTTAQQQNQPATPGQTPIDQMKALIQAVAKDPSQAQAITDKLNALPK